MIKELYNSMNNDLADILKEGSLQETFAKIAKLTEESTMAANERAWSVDSLKNRSVIAHECNLLFESHRLIAGVRQEM